MNRTHPNSTESRAGHGLAPLPASATASTPATWRSISHITDIKKKYPLTAGWISGQLVSTVQQAKSITLRLVAPCCLGLYFLGVVESWPAFCIGAPMALWLGITSLCTAYRLVRIYREGEAALCREAIIRTLHSLKRLSTAIDGQLHSLQQSRAEIHRLAPAGLEMTEQDCIDTESEQKKIRKFRSCTFRDLCKKTKEIKDYCLIGKTRSTVASYNDRLNQTSLQRQENKDATTESIAARILRRRRGQAIEQQKKAASSLDENIKDLETSHRLHRALGAHSRLLARIKNTETLEQYQLYKKEQLKTDLFLLREGRS